ncbi:MAG: glycosyltransferase family 2 protein [Candidatus Anammoxibacter sp.]
MDTHNQYKGIIMVGGSICLDPDATFWTRCDHYCSWYNVNKERSATWAPNHPAANLSVSRSTFQRVGSFKEDLPVTGVHEETEWQGRFLKSGGRIRFEPLAAVTHMDRNSFSAYMKHNYRWGYNSIEVKSTSNVSRFPWIYKKPWILIAGFIPFAVIFTVYTVTCWLKVGKIEPLFITPFIAIGRVAYAIGMAIGGIQSFYRKNRATGI